MTSKLQIKHLMRPAHLRGYKKCLSSLIRSNNHAAGKPGLSTRGGFPVVFKGYKNSLPSLNRSNN